ncbi:MAG: hypothetical protein KAT39_02265, partial [Alphaproteobacteria bacterium]|nr:hypothetical protein [Alphaproteobacteria bacterium]
MVELRGPVVAGVRRDFESTWDRASLFGDIGWLFGSLIPRLADKDSCDRFPMAARGVALRLWCAGGIQPAIFHLSA